MKFENQPGNLLRQIAQSSVKAAAQRPANKDLNNSCSAIGFSLCGQQMVASMGEVVEITHVPDYTTVPRVKDWMLGLANLRGRLLPIIDLERYFGSRLGGNRSRHRVLVIEINNVYAGLVVSNVFGLKHFHIDAFNQPFSGVAEQFSNCVDAIASDGDSEWFRFKPAQLILEENFIDASLNVEASLATDATLSLAGGRNAAA